MCMVMSGPRRESYPYRARRAAPSRPPAERRGAGRRSLVTQGTVEGALRGEKDAVKELYERLRPMLLSVAKQALETPRGRQCRAELDCEDLVQEIFAGIFDREGRVLRLWQPELGRSLEQFVLYHAWHRARTLLRKHGGQRWRERELGEQDLNRISDSGAAAAWLGHRHELASIISRLGEEYAPEEMELFRRYLAEGHTADELRVAYEDLSAASIYQRVSRFMKRARELRGASTAAAP